MVSYPIYNLDLADWDYQSVWGWDPALETLYAQLTRNDSGIDADEQGPEIWITPPAFPRITLPAVLAETIAHATGAATPAVRAAMNDSLPDGDHPLRLHEAPERDTQPVLETVICDFCNRNYTNSAESGGFITESRGWAGCPHCVQRNPKVIVSRTDIPCPPGESFADFIRRVR